MDPASAVAVLAAGGDLVAHEMACVLRDEGEQVALLAILDSYPRLPDARQVDYDEPQALAEVLHSLGLPQEPADGEPLTSETALKIVRSHAGALSTLNATQLSTVARIFTNNLNLQRRHDARFFDGDLLFFEAVAGKGADGERPTDWAPYVGGSVTSQPVDCRHGDMLHPEPLSVIAAALAERLVDLPPAHDGGPSAPTRQETM